LKGSCSRENGQEGKLRGGGQAFYFAAWGTRRRKILQLSLVALPHEKRNASEEMDLVVTSCLRGGPVAEGPWTWSEESRIEEIRHDVMKAQTMENGAAKNDAPPPASQREKRVLEDEEKR